MKKIPLLSLQDHVIRHSIKDEIAFSKMSAEDKAAYLQKYCRDKEYLQDCWYAESIPISKLIIHHTDLHQWVPLNKDQLFIENWPTIKAGLQSISKEPFLSGELIAADEYPPIIVREDSTRKGHFRVWDGQLRVISALHYKKKHVNAYAFIAP